MNFLSEEQIQVFLNQGYVVIDSWLSKETQEAALNEFNELLTAGQFKKAHVTRFSAATAVPRGDWTYWLTESSPPFLRQIEKNLTEWIPALRENFYCGVTSLEAHLAQYPVGPGYDKHVDQPQGKGNRKITFILYLNPSWQKADGGELCLYSSDSQLIDEISPLGRRLVLFRSELFPHEVRPCQQVRRSLTGWFRNDAV